VVQEYIDKPLLIDRMKFDLRLYVLLLGVDPLRVFLFKDGLARLATSPYMPPSESNMHNMQMHLTNYAINKNSSAFSKNHTAVADFIGSKRSFKFVLRLLKNHFKVDTVTLMREIKDLIVKTMISAQPYLASMYRTHHIDDFENSQCFEILGLDIMIDQNFKPYLLEINHAPSFAADSPLDEKIKGQVIYDTLNLLGLSQKRKKHYKQINQLKRELRRFSSKKIALL
jgi:tubulin polyglutamylase TTLL6/13